MNLANKCHNYTKDQPTAPWGTTGEHNCEDTLIIARILL